MNPKLIKNLQQAYAAVRPSVTFGDYLGDGTFSITFAVSDGPVPCAVKFSKKPWASDLGAERERDALLTLMIACNGHPHVASLQFCAEIEGHLATQWERGGDSLLRRLEQCRSQGMPGIPRDELLCYLQHAAEGIDFLNNAQEIVHRDIKPENLLLFQGQVKLVDFGFARLAEARSVTNSVWGTPAYAPPEARNGRLQPNVDIYCLAATFYHLRTGRLPFGKGNDCERRKAALDINPEGLEPFELAALQSALDPDPGKRTYRSAQALVDALAAAPVAEVREQPTRRKPRQVPSSARSVRDKIRLLTVREEQQEAADREAAEERKASQLVQFRRRLGELIDAQDFPAAYATANYLLREAPDDADLLDLKTFLEQPAADGRLRCQDDVGIRFALIPLGEFLMGSPRDEADRRDDEFQHPVSITQPFYLAVHPVTVEQFDRFAYETGHKPGGKAPWTAPGYSQSADHPVVNVSWEDATAFCQWLSVKTGKPYELPTEAQWEYAARGGADRYAAFGVGCGRSLTSVQANFDGRYPYGDAGKGPFVEGTTPVGQFDANGFGLHDMHGNVWEWCMDWYDADYYRQSPVETPTGPEAQAEEHRNLSLAASLMDSGHPELDRLADQVRALPATTLTSRVLRGGSWRRHGSDCRSARRYFLAPAHRHDTCGFRAMLVNPPAESLPAHRP